MRQHHNEFNDALHKTKLSIKDIESPVQRQHSPRQTKTESTISIISSPTSRRQRNHSRRCCTINDILYTIFFVLLFLWILIQHLLAQSFRNTAHDSPDSTMTIVGGQQLQHQPQTMIKWSDQSWRSLGRLIYNDPSESSRNNVSSVISSSQRMEEDYTFIFMLLLGINIATMLPSLLKHVGANMRKKKKQPSSIVTEEDEQAIRYNQLLQTYLPAYLLATSADWLQGPYKYALYSSYGYTKRDIAQLFVAGYGSG